MVITKTPYRLSFFGGGSDFKEWYESNGGLVVGTTFAAYCYLSVRWLPPFFAHRTRLVYSEVEEVNHFDQIKHRGVRSCLEYMRIEDGLEVHHDGDLPARSGIGSSSSFTVGFLKALHAYKGQMIGNAELAQQAIHVEHELEQQVAGTQDQIFAAYGGFNAISFGPGPKHSVSPILVAEEYRKYIESHLLLGFTGVPRSSSVPSQAQVDNIHSGANHDQLTEMVDIAHEGLQLFSSQADMRTVGQLLQKSWRVKKACSAKVSNPEIDDLVDLALGSGALGCKVMGAGGGGFMAFLVPPEQHEDFKQRLRGIKVWVPFRFEDEGSKVIFYRTGEAAGKSALRGGGEYSETAMR